MRRGTSPGVAPRGVELHELSGRVALYRSVPATNGSQNGSLCPGIEVMRLAEVRDPQPVPALEQPIRVTGHHRPVALQQEHATTAAREGERRRQASQPSPEHNNVAVVPHHTSNHQRLHRKGKAVAFQHRPLTWSSSLSDWGI
jgi:hypothetical protein